MNKNEIFEIANQTAGLIINKSFWGNEWFLLFSLLLMALLAGLVAWGGAYLSTRAQNKALRVDFEKALVNLEKQTNAIKQIEERIAHDFIQKRELNSIKRSKIEEIYLALQDDLELLVGNLSETTLDSGKGLNFPKNRVEMLTSLYFKEELEKEIIFFRDQRNALLKQIHILAKQNLDKSSFPNEERIKLNAPYVRNLNQAKNNIELALEDMMKKLTI